jgi:hypothetical protein
MKRPKHYPFLPPVPDALLTKEQATQQRENYRELHEIHERHVAMMHKIFLVSIPILLAMLAYSLAN